MGERDRASAAEAMSSGLLDLVAYTGCRAMAAEGVLLAVDDGTAVTVRAETGSGVGGGPSVRGWRVHGIARLPIRQLTEVTVERRPDRSLAISLLPEQAPVPGSPANPGSGRTVAVRTSAADGVDILVLVERPAPSARGREEALLHHLLDAAADTLVACGHHGELRVRAGLQQREEERRRWARELHDETLQQLGALQVLLTSTSRRAGRGSVDGEVDRDRVLGALDQASALLEGQIKSLRHLITELRPATLDDLGLTAPLHALGRRTEELTGLRVDVEVSLRYADGDASTRLLPDVELAIYRVVQEALTNISRHARATRARISVVESGAWVRVEVRDDGTGLARGSSASGFGIAGMRERAALAGGRLELLPVLSAGAGTAPAGTVVRLVVPATHRRAAERVPGDAARRSTGAEQPQP